MNSRYFYVEIVCDADQTPLSLRRAVEEAATQVLGSAGAGPVCDVLRCGGGRGLLRVEARAVSRLRAALLLAGASLRPGKLSPVPQALI